MYFELKSNSYLIVSYDFFFPIIKQPSFKLLILLLFNESVLEYILLRMT